MVEVEEPPSEQCTGHREVEYVNAVGPIDPGAIMAACQKLGAEGWEMCGQVPLMNQTTVLGSNGVIQSGPPQMQLMLIFKRPKDLGRCTETVT